MTCSNLALFKRCIDFRKVNGLQNISNKIGSWKFRFRLKCAVIVNVFREICPFPYLRERRLFPAYYRFEWNDRILTEFWDLAFPKQHCFGIYIHTSPRSSKAHIPKSQKLELRFDVYLNPLSSYSKIVVKKRKIFNWGS